MMATAFCCKDLLDIASDLLWKGCFDNEVKTVHLGIKQYCSIKYKGSEWCLFMHYFIWSIQAVQVHAVKLWQKLQIVISYDVLTSGVDGNKPIMSFFLLGYIILEWWPETTVGAFYQFVQN